jgi:hypothetical protein
MADFVSPALGVPAVKGDGLDLGEGVRGESRNDTFAGVAGIQLNRGSTGAGVYGEHRGDGPGGSFTSLRGEGVHGETFSRTFAAVAGIQRDTVAVGGSGGAGVFGQHMGNGPAGFFTSQRGEGVHGETNAEEVAAVAGIQLNRGSTGAGVYGEHRGDGPAGSFKGRVEVVGDLAVHGMVTLQHLNITGADCAENFDVVQGAELEPGTVMVIGREGALQQSRDAYDTRVAGVISGAGAYRPAIVLDQQPSREHRVPIALMGKVYCKVDAQYGAIEAGDRLTTSPTAGHAMKVTDPTRGVGATIGKALLPMDEGTGLLPILVALH